MRLATIALLSLAVAPLAHASEGADAAPASRTVTTAGVPSAGLAPPAPEETARSASRPPSPRATGRSPAARATRAGVVLELRSDFGLDRLVQVEFSNDRRASMELNGGLGVSAGMSFLPVANGRLGTRVTAGFKLARLRASNGAALFTAFPVELMEAAYLGPVRVGAGVSVLVRPRVSGDGIFEPLSTTFRAAPGAVADAEWIVSGRARTGIGLRASWNRFEAQGRARGAPAIGLVVRSDFDVAGR